jgi:hypothetical protein
MLPLTLSGQTKDCVISTEAAHGIIVRCVVEKSAFAFALVFYNHLWSQQLH